MGHHWSFTAVPSGRAFRDVFLRPDLAFAPAGIAIHRYQSPHGSSSPPSAHGTGSGRTAGSATSRPIRSSRHDQGASPSTVRAALLDHPVCQYLAGAITLAAACRHVALRIQAAIDHICRKTPPKAVYSTRWRIRWRRRRSVGCLLLGQTLLRAAHDGARQRPVWRSIPSKLLTGSCSWHNSVSPSDADPSAIFSSLPAGYAQGELL